MATPKQNAEAIRELAESVRTSNKSLEALSGALMQFVILGEERSAGIEDLVNRHRRLGKYNRRTHFWTMAAMVFGAMFLADMAQHAHSVWWDLLFWSHNHGDGGTSDYVLRTLGLVWQVGYLTYLVRIAQVPLDLWPDVTAAQIKREKDARRKEGRRKFFRLS